MDIFILSAREDALKGFAQGLEGFFPQSKISFAHELSQAKDFIKNIKSGLLIVDELETVKASKDCLIDFLSLNAFINMALISRKSEKELHDELEGLGLLSILPFEAKKDDAAALFEAFKKIS